MEMFDFDFDVHNKYANELIEKYPLLHPQHLITGIIFYVLSIYFFQPSQSMKKHQNKQNGKKVIGPMQLMIFTHNLLLAIYSLITFVITAPIVYQWFMEEEPINVVCGFYNLANINPTFAFWNYLFYLSKYYEFIDTFIVILKGKKPSFLQMYHHIGAVIGMWLICITGSVGPLFFTVTNSFIHSIMYSYYALTVIGYKFPLFIKSVITKLQIIQFMIGIAVPIYHLYDTAYCLTIGEILCLVYHMFYLGYLLYLFIQFYSSTYYQKQTNRKTRIE